MTDINGTATGVRPPIVLTSHDRERLFVLTDAAGERATDAVRFLREELERANVISADTRIVSLVTMGSAVTFVDHQAMKIQRGTLVYPEQADNRRNMISVLSPLGSALLGLGPGQSIDWNDSGKERRLTVLDVQPKLNQWN